MANQVVEATIGWMVLFHDPDGLEIHLYSRDRGGPGQLRPKPGFGRRVQADRRSDRHLSITALRRCSG